MKHKHRAIPRKSYDRAYFHAVAWPENQAAHGNICRTEQCSCGAKRSININGRHREVGGWWNESAADVDYE